MKPWWTVQVIETATGEVVKSIAANSERQAEKLERGLQINLNTDKFHVVTRSWEDD